MVSLVAQCLFLRKLCFLLWLQIVIQQEQVVLLVALKSALLRTKTNLCLTEFPFLSPGCRCVPSPVGRSAPPTVTARLAARRRIPSGLRDGHAGCVVPSSALGAGGRVPAVYLASSPLTVPVRMSMKVAQATRGIIMGILRGGDAFWDTVSRPKSDPISPYR